MTIVEQFLNLIIELAEAALNFLFEFIEMLFTNVPKKNKGYNAEFASAGTILSRGGEGFCLTGVRNLDRKRSYENALIIGGTGVGKSSVVLIPSLYTMRSSFIVHDPSGELHSRTAGYLKQRGYTILVLNPSNPAISSGYNPLSRVRSSSEIQKVASMLVDTAFGQKTKDPFWNTQAVALLSMFITVLNSFRICLMYASYSINWAAVRRVSMHYSVRTQTRCFLLSTRLSLHTMRK